MSERSNVTASASDSRDDLRPKAQVVGAGKAQVVGMILCAGLGTRLRPLTLRVPKPAVPVCGLPLVSWTLGLLAGAGVSRAVVNVHHLPDAMAAVAETGARAAGLPLAVSREPVIAGTGGALREASRHLAGADEIVVVNGDVLFDVDLGAALAAHRASGALATMVLLPMPPGAAYATVDVDAWRRGAPHRGEVRAGRRRAHLVALLRRPRPLPGPPRPRPRRAVRVRREPARLPAAHGVGRRPRAGGGRLLERPRNAGAVPRGEPGRPPRPRAARAVRPGRIAFRLARARRGGAGRARRDVRGRRAARRAVLRRGRGPRRRRGGGRGRGPVGRDGARPGRAGDARRRGGDGPGAG